MKETANVNCIAAVAQYMPIPRYQGVLLHTTDANLTTTAREIMLQPMMPWAKGLHAQWLLPEHHEYL